MNFKYIIAFLLIIVLFNQCKQNNELESIKRGNRIRAGAAAMQRTLRDAPKCNGPFCFK